MDKIYTLSNSAGLLRSNTFEELEEAVLLGSTRAKITGLPVKISEYENKEYKSILICNPDGSVEKPQGEAHDGEIDMGFDAGKDVASQSHILLASFEDKKVTTFYLRSEFPETKLKELEDKSQVSIGLYDPECLIAYEQDSRAVARIEEYLSHAGIEVDRVEYSQYKKKTAAPLLVEAAFHVRSNDTELKKIKPVTFTFGPGSKVRKWECVADVWQDSKTKKLKYLVKVNGRPVGSTSSYRTCLRLIREEALTAMSRYLDQVL